MRVELYPPVLDPAVSRLTPLRVVRFYRSGAVWECLCRCGRFCEVRRDKLVAGRTISCGCRRRGFRPPPAPTLIEEALRRGVDYEKLRAAVVAGAARHPPITAQQILARLGEQLPLDSRAAAVHDQVS